MKPKGDDHVAALRTRRAVLAGVVCFLGGLLVAPATHGTPSADRSSPSSSAVIAAPSNGPVATQDVGSPDPEVDPQPSPTGEPAQDPDKPEKPKPVKSEEPDLPPLPDPPKDPRPAKNPTKITEPVDAEPASPEAGTPTAGSADPSAEVAERTDRLAEATEAVLQASDALRIAEDQLADAEQRLSAAERAARQAKAAHEQATDDLKVARVAERQAGRRVKDTVTAVERQQQTLGSLAREAYQGGGQLASLSVVLDSTTPAEFAGRLTSMQALVRSEDAVIAELGTHLADQREAENRLSAARAMREDMEERAERLLIGMRSTRDSARLIETQAAKLVDYRGQALSIAKAAKAADLADYRSFIATSNALSTSVVGWSTDLEQSGNTVKGTGVWARPGTGTLSSPFGPRFHPILRYTKLHTGADYSPGDGIVYSADRGTVLVAGYNTAYGNMVVIGHGRQNGQWIATLYGHMASLFVKTGQVLPKGTELGFVGSTGYSTGPHLHFEIRVDGIPVDPEPLLAGAGTPRTSAATKS